MSRSLARTALLVVSLAAGCVQPTRSPRAGSDEDPAPATGRTISRYSTNRRAIYGLDELRGMADELAPRLAALRTDRPGRVAFYYFTLDGRRHHHGESIAQSLSSLLVERAHSQYEVYTRRKLGRVLSELRHELHDLMDPTSLGRIGKLAGLDAIVAGRLTRQRSGVRVHCQVIDVETGRIAGGARTDLSGDETRLTGVVRRPSESAVAIARNLSSRLPEDIAWRIAVYDLTRSRRAWSTGRELAEEVASELAGEASHIAVLTRSALDQVLEEQKLERSDLFDEDTIVRIARLAGGNAVLTGFAEAWRDVVLLNVQVIEVETARVVAATIEHMKRPISR